MVRNEHHHPPPPPHFLLVTFAAQGHINPSLQFAKRLILTTGAHVTFITTVSAHRRMLKSLSHPNLTYAPFSDGFDDGFKPNEHDIKTLMSELERRGSESLAQTITSSSLANVRLHVIYTILLPWAADVAHNLTVPSSLLWIQPAIVFDVYYYYFNGYKDLIGNNNNDPSYPIKLPGLPLLTCNDIPSFFLPSGESAFPSILLIFEKQFQVLHKSRENSKRKPRVLVNTFDALEKDAITAVKDQFDLIGIGPLIPSAFLDKKDPSDVSFGGDLFHASQKEDYIEWLDSREESSVVYVSFGSLSVLSPKQMDELARGLIESGRPFLWVIRPQNNKAEDGGEEDGGEGSRMLSYIEKEGIMMKEMWKIVKWCSQVEVLSHKSVGCFVTHCGWNSSLEGLVCGIPMVGFPQWSDQGTNAKLIEDVWRVGVRVREKKRKVEGEDDENYEKIVESEEVRRCLDIVMGNDERGEEMRRNARKWKELGKEAVVEGGSSERNLWEFVEGYGDLGL